MDRLNNIEDRAATLLAKRDSGDWTDEDQAQLVAWMEEATAHRIAVLRLEAAWESAGRLKALSAGLPPGTVPPARGWKHFPFFEPRARAGAIRAAAELEQASRGNVQSRRPSRRWRFFPTSLAASILLTLVSAGAWYLWPTGDRYYTPIGGVASVPLNDGSKITLNTASEVRVALTPKERRVELDKGEAYFEVAHDPSRPFIVQVGNKRVVAVGTKFSVRRNGDDIRVVVTEGKVRVERTAGAGTEVSQEQEQGPGKAFLTPGSIASAGDDGIVVQERALAELEGGLSWRQGYLTFHDTSLADAVAEFNRYNAHRITIEDSKVAAIRISGTFRAVNYEAFVRVLDDGFAIHASNTEDTTTLTQ